MVKRKIKAVLAQILALLTVLPFLASCSDESLSYESSSEQYSVSAEEQNFPEIDSYVASLAAGCTFDGSNFNIISRELSVLPEKEEED